MPANTAEYGTLTNEISFRYTPPWLLNMKATSLRTYLVLLSLTQAPSTTATASLATLSALLDRAPSNVLRYLMDLEKHGVIRKVHNQGETGVRLANTYEVRDLLP